MWRRPRSSLFVPAVLGLLLSASLTLAVLPRLAHAQPAAALRAANGELGVVEAREAVRRRDRQRLAAARATAQAAQHPLLPWVEYWDLSSRLGDATPDEVDAFFVRWSGSYVEDRLRNDWLLELGKRRDWAALAREYPRFRMNDDREVRCWWLLTEHLQQRDVRDAARDAWFAQREPDDGCSMLATALVDTGKFSADDVWRKARLSVEAQRPAVARAAIGLLGNAAAREAGDALDEPMRYLRQKTGRDQRLHRELRVLALMRVAANDPDVAAGLLERHGAALTPAQAAWTWAYTGRQAAFRLSADAAGHYRRAWALLPKPDAAQPGWSDETLAWAARSALRATRERDRWALLLRAIDTMPAPAQAEPTWVYWKARALLASAKGDDAAADAKRAQARQLLGTVAHALHFYGQLAAEDLGAALPLPPAPPAPTPAERDAARATPGLARAMMLAELGLRDEARREWNFTLRGMGERELLAAAQWACEASDWQICINTSDRTRDAVDLATRYPMPFAAETQEAARAAGVDPALVFGLIRQETRFMAQLKSHAGATGLMQLMPATARWIAKRQGIELSEARARAVYDPALNLKLGVAYLKLVLDDLAGSQAMAAAAYNAGPGRPRRWREGPTLEPAIWAENVPFAETRDYVKKVLSNASVYAALLGGPGPLLKPRLGAAIGPRDAAIAVNTELP